MSVSERVGWKRLSGFSEKTFLRKENDMTEEEYKRILAYEHLQHDVKTLEDAALIIENHWLVPYSDERKQEILFNAISLCQASLPILFRETAYTIKKKMEKI